MPARPGAGAACPELTTRNYAAYHEQCYRHLEYTPTLIRAQDGVSRHAKCYRAVHRRAGMWVTHERTASWEPLEWDHMRDASIWHRCGSDTSKPRRRPRARSWTKSAR